VGKTTGSAWIGVFRDAFLVCGDAYRDAVMGCRVVCRDTGWEGIVDVTTDPICGGACRDAVWGSGGACHNANLGCVDAFRDAFLGCGDAYRDAVVGSGVACRDAVVVCGVACLDADLGGTADVIAGP